MNYFKNYYSLITLSFNRVFFWVLMSFCAILFSAKISAQNFNSGFLPDITLSFKINETLSYINKSESRLRAYDDNNNEFKIKFERFDFQNFLQRKVGLYSKLAVGYQYRIRSGKADEHRSIQQFSWASKFSQIKLGQRIRSDQTFSSIEKPEYRMRYRSKMLIPLQGRQLDKNEYYLSISDELLWAFQNNLGRLENHIVFKIGFYINDKSKIEWGLDWRIQSLLSSNLKHQLWMGLSWYRSL